MSFITHNYDVNYRYNIYSVMMRFIYIAVNWVEKKILFERKKSKI